VKRESEREGERERERERKRERERESEREREGERERDREGSFAMQTCPRPLKRLTGNTFVPEFDFFPFLQFENGHVVPGYPGTKVTRSLLSHFGRRLSHFGKGVAASTPSPLCLTRDDRLFLS
jgi:hypothetical protein